MSVFIIRTTAGRERQVAERLILLADKEKGVIKAILNPELIRGYLFVESENIDVIKQAIYGMHHVKGVIAEPVSVDQLNQFITAAPKLISVKEGDIVELISGPFKGEKAKVKRFNKVKDEVVVELLEAAVPIPMNISVDSVRVISSGSEEGEKSQGTSEERDERENDFENMPANIKLIKKGERREEE